jgi:hypothetical protein
MFLRSQQAPVHPIDFQKINAPQVAPPTYVRTYVRNASDAPIGNARVINCIAVRCCTGRFASESGLNNNRWTT